MIRLAGLRKQWGARLALEGLTLEVRAGEAVALIGPNGAGKSTALKSVAGSVRPTSGEVWINGYDAVKQPVEARRLLGYVPQRLLGADHVTCADLMDLALALRGAGRDAGRAALERVDLADRRHERVRELSGGQRQRLSLALALAGEPKALVLDEPSISLDADGAEVVRSAIMGARAGGAAVLFASHHLAEVAHLADRVVVLREGRVAASADASQLRDAALFESFYRGALFRAVMHAA